MDSINSFLGRFKKIFLEEEERRNTILNAIEESTNIKINPKNIEIKGKDIFIKCSPIEKNEIYFKKEKILSTLREKGLVGIENIM